VLLLLLLLLLLRIVLLLLAWPWCTGALAVLRLAATGWRRLVLEQGTLSLQHS
jgi:hypothetical protein